MTHLPDLIRDLALILISAGIVTVLFKWLKQPLVLGYIVVGFLVGPHVNLLLPIIDVENVSVWSEIGIVFLLFALGLEFRLKKLFDVGKPAFIAALINMLLMIALGCAVGTLMHRNALESLFLGGMISMSSTTIIVKAFDEMNKRNERFANIVLGILVIEDIAAILMMVLFSTIAVSRAFEGMQLIESLLKLIFFMVIWFTVGIYLIPTWLKRLKAYMNDETLLILSIGFCLGMVLFAHYAGFSPALGAFIAGSVLAETLESKRIEELVAPLRHLFGAVFFVSVGMMIVPEMIAAHLVPILTLTVIVLVGRVLFGTLGVLLPGESLQTSIRAGFSLAQIGEFSFIIATLGIQLNVIDEFIYPVIVAVSVITTFTTPYGIRCSGQIYAAMEKKIPKKWNKILTERYPEKTAATGDLGRFLQKFFTPLAIYFILSIAVMILSKMLVVPFITEKIDNVWGAIAAAGVTIVMMSSFLYGMIKHRPNVASLYFRLLFRNEWYYKILLPVNILPKLAATGLILTVLIPLFPDAGISMIIISMFVLVFISANPWLEYRTEKMEQKFLENINASLEDEQYIFSSIYDHEHHSVQMFMHLFRNLLKSRRKWNEMTFAERREMMNRRKQEWASMSHEERLEFFDNLPNLNHEKRMQIWYDTEQNMMEIIRNDHEK